jgi:Cu+-exporting ATPase
MSATTEEEAAERASESVRVDLPVTGMTCAACARRVERRLAKTHGVSAANVNFATERATVEYDPARTGVRQLKEAVREIGYGLVDTTPLLVISMSHGAVALFNVSWINYLQLALTIPVVFYSGAPFYRGAWAALRHRAADMNTLIATGTGAAFLYSVAATLAPRLVAGAGGAASMNGM